MSRSDSERLQDILDAIAHARLADERLRLADAGGDEQGVRLAFQAILHNLFVIGEAVKALSPEILEAAPDIPWSEIAATRDVIGHQYHRILPDLIHRTVREDLPPLERSVRALMAPSSPKPPHCQTPLG